VAGDANGRINVGNTKALSQVLIAEPRPTSCRQHHPSITAGHVRALVYEGRTLDLVPISHTSRLPLPCCSVHRPKALPTESPAAILVLKVLDTTKQQEEAGRGSRAEQCAHTASGTRYRREIERQENGDTHLKFVEQRPSCPAHNAHPRCWYVV
jgi:hypothetical protein